MSTKNVPQLRISHVLQQHLDRLGGYSALARAITDRNEDLVKKPGVDVIDRRKLKSLIEGKPGLSLSLEDFQALDRYLEPFGEGLAYKPLFDRPDILRSLAESRHVAFLLGARPDGVRVYVDHCDVRSMSQIQRLVNAMSPGVKFETFDVELYKDVERARRGSREDDWQTLVGGGASLVSVATERANHATAWMLAGMFDVEAFGHADPALPFHFIWKPELTDVLPSPFHQRPLDLGPNHPDADRLARASALELQGEVFVDEISLQGFGHTYGICAAQRRAEGQIWVVIAGVTGLATYAGAKLLEKIDTRLSEDPKGQHSKVFFTPVRATLREKPLRAVDNLREIRDETVLREPQAWEPGRTARVTRS